MCFERVTLRRYNVLVNTTAAQEDHRSGTRRSLTRYGCSDESDSPRRWVIIKVMAKQRVHENNARGGLLRGSIRDPLLHLSINAYICI